MFCDLACAELAAWGQPPQYIFIDINMARQAVAAAVKATLIAAAFFLPPPFLPKPPQSSGQSRAM